MPIVAVFFFFLNLDTTLDEILRLENETRRNAAVASYIDACITNGDTPQALAAFEMLTDKSLLVDAAVAFAKYRQASDTSRSFNRLRLAYKGGPNTARWNHLSRKGGFRVDTDGQVVHDMVWFDQPPESALQSFEFPLDFLQRIEFADFGATVFERHGSARLGSFLQGLPKEQPLRKLLALDVLKECYARDGRPALDDVSEVFEFESERLALRQLLDTQKTTELDPWLERDLRREARLIRPSTETPSAKWWFVGACNQETQRGNIRQSIELLNKAASMRLFDARFKYHNGTTTYAGNDLARSVALCIEEARAGNLRSAIGHLKAIALPTESEARNVESLAAAYVSAGNDLSKFLSEVVDPELRARLRIGAVRKPPVARTVWSEPQMFYGLIIQAEMIRHKVGRNESEVANLSHWPIVLPQADLNKLIKDVAGDRTRALKLLWDVPEVRANDVAPELLLQFLESDDDDVMLLASRLSVRRDDLRDVTRQALMKRTNTRDQETRYAALSLLYELSQRNNGNITVQLHDQDDDPEIQLILKLHSGTVDVLDSARETSNSWLIGIARHNKNRQ